jgi:hypothetical protein
LGSLNNCWIAISLMLLASRGKGMRPLGVPSFRKPTGATPRFPEKSLPTLYNTAALRILRPKTAYFRKKVKKVFGGHKTALFDVKCRHYPSRKTAF